MIERLYRHPFIRWTYPGWWIRRHILDSILAAQRGFVDGWNEQGSQP